MAAGVFPAGCAGSGPITLAIGIQGFITFPALIAARQKILKFRDNNKIVANIIFYLLTPIFFIALLIFLIYLFEV